MFTQFTVGRENSMKTREVDPWFWYQCCQAPHELPEQALTVDQFMAALTTGGARYLGEQDSRGSIEPGKSADLVVLRDDPYVVPPFAFSEIDVLLTMHEGRIVFDAGK